MNLKNEVKNVVENFIKQNLAFTALDVSNKVKESFPEVRHRNVRDEVRELYNTEMQLDCYAATPITVTLDDGISTAQAILYHHMADSWDLDNVYDTKKRAQISKKPVVSVPQILNTASNNTATVVATDGHVTVSSVSSGKITKTSAKDLWENLFSNQSSLFPVK